MKVSHNIQARERPFNLMLNENLVQRAKGMTNHLSGVVESLLSQFVAQEQTRRLDKEKLINATVATWNDFHAKSGSFSDEYSSL